MDANGLSLLPGSIPSELSRGHPLFFHFATGIWMSLFGGSRVSLHAFNLLISTVLLWAVYNIGSRLGSKTVGLGAALFVAGHEMFLAQSALLLPETMVALFILGAMDRYVARDSIGYFILASLALLTKESALVLIIALLAMQLLRHMATKGSPKSSDPGNWVLVSASPLIPVGLFFLYQRISSGWFLYPQHVGLMTWDPADILYKAKFIFTTFFEGQGTMLLIYAMAFVAPAIRRPFKPIRSVVIMLLYTVAIKVLFGRWPVPSDMTMIVPLLCFMVLVFMEYLPMASQDPARRGEFITIAFLFCIAYWSFSSINFFSDRYLLCLVPILALGSSLILFGALKGLHPLIFPSVMSLLCAVQLVHIGRDEKVGDTKLAYADAIHVQQNLITHLIDHDLTRSSIYAPFMEKLYMSDGSLGYLPEGIRMSNVDDKLMPATEYALVNNTSTSEMMAELQQKGFRVVYRSTSGKAWGELWQRIAGQKDT
jgi:hypothetical protein